jgi:nitronate monooxygenase
MKDKAVASGGDQTAQTRVFDIVRAAAWPAIYPGRALRNDFFAQWQGKEDALQAEQKQVEAGYTASAPGDFSQRVVWAGESVDLVRDIPTARDVIERIVDEAAAVLQSRAALVRQ